jgi:hypothetical protein
MNDDPAANDHPGSNDLRSSQPGSYSFSVATLLGATALVAGSLGLGLVFPPLGAIFAGICLLALIRTRRIISQHWQITGRSLSRKGRRNAFLWSMASVAGIFLASAAPLFLAPPLFAAWEKPIGIYQWILLLVVVGFVAASFMVPILAVNVFWPISRHISRWESQRAKLADHEPPPSSDEAPTS